MEMTVKEVKKLPAGTEILRNGQRARVIRCGSRKMLRVLKNGYPDLVMIKEGEKYEQVDEDK